MLAKSKEKSGKFAVGHPSKRDEAVLDAGGCRVASVLWDYSLDGGAVGTISFGRLLPSGCIVSKVWTDEQTAVTAATSITLKAGSTALTGALDLTASSGIQNPALAGSAAGIKLSADSELNIAIATTAATAGKVRFYVQYLLAND
jgi:hypothetical protein